MAKGHLTPSRLSGQTTEFNNGVRTSYGASINASSDQTGTVGLIEEKLARVTMLPRNYGEAFNVLRYEIGQKFVPHFDTYGRGEEQHGRQGPRVASFLLYLTDVEEGGETMFPYENGDVHDKTRNYSIKSVGFKVKPRQGDALLFYSLLPNGILDQTSCHSSCPVIKGEKWVATKWIEDCPAVRRNLLGVA